MERGIEKGEKGFKELFDRGKLESVGETDAGGSAASGSIVNANATAESIIGPNSSKVWAISKGTFKIAMGIAAKLVPEPFKGPAEALLKVVDVIEVCISFISFYACCSCLP
jgi:hypothetical protein